MSYNRPKNKASLHRKQGFFTIKTRLVCDAKKPCLKSRENEHENETAHCVNTIFLGQTLLKVVISCKF